MNTPATVKETRRQYILFVIFIAIIGAFSSLVNDMYLPTMPAMRHEFDTSASMTQLGLSAAMLGLGIGSLIWGSLSDHYGRKPMLVISLIIFCVGTIVSIFSPTIVFFDVCRLVQGFGAGGSMVLSTSIPADRYQGRQLAAIMALVGALNGVVPAASPLIGGFMADDFGWRGIFVLLLLIGAGMLVWSTRRPESLPAANRIQSKDLSGYIQAYKKLIINGRFMLFVVMKAIGIGVLYAYISSAPFILQEHYGFTAAQFGMIFGANALVIPVGSIMVMKFKAIKRGTSIGALIMAVFSACLGIALYKVSHFMWFEIFAIPMLFGCGMVFSGSNSLAMQEGRRDAGTASAVLSVVKYILAASVAPLVGIGNMMHSSGVAFVVIAVTAVIIAFFTNRLSPEAGMVRS